jgi:hypothetical protein
MAKIDRIFVCTDWEAIFPLPKVVALAKGTSDHNTLLLSSGDECAMGKKRFRFEKWWLQREDFRDLVRRTWEKEYPNMEVMDRW